MLSPFAFSVSIRFCHLKSKQSIILSFPEIFLSAGRSETWRAKGALEGSLLQISIQPLFGILAETAAIIPMQTAPLGVPEAVFKKRVE